MSATFINSPISYQASFIIYTTEVLSVYCLYRSYSRPYRSTQEAESLSTGVTQHREGQGKVVKGGEGWHWPQWLTLQGAQGLVPQAI
jgi:hypothetical protein